MPSALAADLDVPPPDLRQASFDWSGPYIGVFGAAVAVDGSFDGTCSCLAIYTDIEHSGIGYAGGILGGWNYQMDSIVFGVEGDWAFGGTVATNDEPAIDTDLSFNNIATVRARAGFALDNTLLYVTGGLAAVDMEFGALLQIPWTTATGFTVGLLAAVLSTPSLRTSVAGLNIFTWTWKTPITTWWTEQRRLTPPSRSTISTWSALVSPTISAGKHTCITDQGPSRAPFLLPPLRPS